MLTRPQLYEAKAETHEAKAEAKTQDGEARFFDLKAQFGAKFMRRQRFFFASLLALRVMHWIEDPAKVKLELAVWI